MGRSRRQKDTKEKLQIFRDSKAKEYSLPYPKKKGDVGFDLTSTEDVVIPPGIGMPPTEIPTGIRVRLPKGVFAVIFPRSSTYSNFPTLVICSAPIDNGYIGPLNPRFRNLGLEPVTIKKGDRIAQLVIFSAVVPKIVEVKSLQETDRGESRYGSTGRK